MQLRVCSQIVLAISTHSKAPSVCELHMTTWLHDATM